MTLQRSLLFWETAMLWQFVFIVRGKGPEGLCFVEVFSAVAKDRREARECVHEHAAGLENVGRLESVRFESQSEIPPGHASSAAYQDGGVFVLDAGPIRFRQDHSLRCRVVGVSISLLAVAILAGWVWAYFEGVIDFKLPLMSILCAVPAVWVIGGNRLAMKWGMALTLVQLALSGTAVMYLFTNHELWTYRYNDPMMMYYFILVFGTITGWTAINAFLLGKLISTTSIFRQTIKTKAAGAAEAC